MTTIHTNVLSDEELNYLNNLPEVLSAKATLDSRTSGMVYFSIAITDSIRSTLQSRFGLDLSTRSTIPMRWIKGDTAPHIDTGASNFQNTYLLYLNDSPGELIVDSQSYPIEANSGFVFNEGVSHETRATDNVSRLLLGPMNEFAEPVGFYISYYPTEYDALTLNMPTRLGSGPTIVGSTSSFTVGDGGPYGGYTSWRIASNSTGSSSKSPVYRNGDILIADNNYYLYPAGPCFLEGTTILCQVDGVDSYLPIEQLNVGTLVKTSLNGYKKVVLIGKGAIHNPGNVERIENRLYKCSPSKYPELTNDLYITGCHSILEFPITEKQKEDTMKHFGKLFVTDKKYRLIAYLDERAEPWNSEGKYTIWNFALENNHEKMNYGVYANGGLLVESCSIMIMKDKSNMTLTI
jgi:hypothetical protein